jgi:hypothetical protein
VVVAVCVVVREGVTVHAMKGKLAVRLQLAGAVVVVVTVRNCSSVVLVQDGEDAPQKPCSPYE